MTASALTRPGERDRLPVKIGQIEWRLAGLLAIVAGAGAMMLYSLGGQDWQPWAAAHAIRFGALFTMMLCLALVEPRWWYAVAYPTYGFIGPAPVERSGS